LALDGSEGTASHPGCLTPNKEPKNLIEYESGWNSEPVRNYGKKKGGRDLCPCRKSKTGFPSNSRSLFWL